MNVQGWIDEKLSELSKKLPTMIHNDPASFACGYNMGYKGALIDLDRFLEEEEESEI